MRLVAVKLAVAEPGEGCGQTGMDILRERLEGGGAGSLLVPVHDVAAYGGLGTPMGEEPVEVGHGCGGLYIG